jgi:hypothetical protein
VRLVPVTISRWNTDAPIVGEAENAKNASERVRTPTSMKTNRSASIAQEQASAPPVTVTDRH